MEVIGRKPEPVGLAGGAVKAGSSVVALAFLAGAGLLDVRGRFFEGGRAGTASVDIPRIGRDADSGDGGESVGIAPSSSAAELSGFEALFITRPSLLAVVEDSGDASRGDVDEDEGVERVPKSGIGRRGFAKKGLREALNSAVLIAPKPSAGRTVADICLRASCLLAFPSDS